MLEKVEEVLLRRCRLVGAEEERVRGVRLGPATGCTGPDVRVMGLGWEEFAPAEEGFERRDEPRVGGTGGLPRREGKEGTGGTPCFDARALRSPREDDRFGIAGRAETALSLDRIEEDEERDGADEDEWVEGTGEDGRAEQVCPDTSETSSALSRRVLSFGRDEAGRWMFVKEGTAE